LFICTANTLDTISPPLLDRCEIIQLSGYTHDEKLHITRRFLLPKQVTQNGLSEAYIELTEPALLQTVTHYTQEAGVRRNCTIQGSKALVQRSKNDGASYNRVVEVDELEKILGPSRYDGEDREREPQRGVVWGLVVTGMGEGAIMPVESIATHGSGHLKLTSPLGEVRPELAHPILTVPD
jgi:ATP-dependent Lon protease